VKSSYFLWVLPGIVLIGLCVYLYGRADSPTRLTNDDGLAAQRLPTELPALSSTTNLNDDAATYYEQAINLYAAQRSALTGTREHDELVAGICELLELAAQAGRVPDGFMDAHIPVKIGAYPDFDDALEEVFTLAIYQSAYRYSHKDPDGARDLALAVWVFGRRMFEHNVRLYNRNTGLDMMESAGSLLYDMSANDPSVDTETLRAWSQAIDEIRRQWQPKLQAILGIDPPIGDLVNIALNDQDRMFRVEATLRLGIHQHSPVGRGNQRAIQDAIQVALRSDDPILAEAARAAEAMTLQEKRRLY
jgi:hypothetical protein